MSEQKLHFGAKYGLGIPRNSSESIQIDIAETVNLCFTSSSGSVRLLTAVFLEML